MRSAAALVVLLACGSNPGGGTASPDAGGGAGHDGETGGSKKIRTVFVIPLENKADTAIYGNLTSAPYINGLFSRSNHATNFRDELPGLDSEPHYVWMEAGTNVFPDRTFSTDNDASGTNSTANANHLVTQLTAAGVSWTSFQEGIADGVCPIGSTGNYAAKHDPFVFFRDVAGATPSKTNAECAAHHKPYSALAAALAADQVSGYVFITPDLCHDMHGALGCPSGLTSSANIKAGDTWLASELPRILSYADTHDAVVFLTWDEGSSTNLMPFMALGSHVRTGASATMFTHSSLLKTVEEIFGVAVLPTVTAANDLADMFEPGTL
ncbi:alkaline phosphatase family protein [soil metagenome]